jgi:hypothetical protein
MRDTALNISGSEHRLRSENLAFDIDVWHPPLENHTFRSEFLPMTVDEATAILAYNDVSWRGARTALTLDEVATLEALEHRIDAELRRSFGERGAFLRLCGRSPKDGEPTDEKPVRTYGRAISARSPSWWRRSTSRWTATRGSLRWHVRNRGSACGPARTRCRCC